MDTLSFVDAVPSVASAPLSVTVSPAALVSILDQSARRPATDDRVVGIAFGQVTAGVVEINHTYGLYHKLDASTEKMVRIPLKTVQSIIDMHLVAFPKESLVAWYTTRSGPEFIESSTLLLQKYFLQFSAKMVHLVVDTTLVENKVGLYAFHAMPVYKLFKTTVPFQQLKVSVVASREERAAIDAIVAPTVSSRETGSKDVVAVQTDLDALETSVRVLKSVLDSAQSYVDDVVSGKLPADETMGRGIAEALAAVPAMDAEAYAKVASGAAQDQLMATYLSAMAAAQIKLTEKILTSSF